MAEPLIPIKTIAVVTRRFIALPPTDRPGSLVGTRIAGERQSGLHQSDPDFCSDRSSFALSQTLRTCYLLIPGPQYTVTCLPPACRLIPPASPVRRTLPMPTRVYRWLFLLAAATLFPTPAFADLYNTAPSPPTWWCYRSRPTSRRSPSIPRSLTIRGMDDAAQLVVTATLKDGRLQDLTGDVKYEVADTKVARVTADRPHHPAGQRHAPRSPPRYGDKSVKVAVNDREHATSTCRSTSPTRSCRSSPSSAATAAAATARRRPERLHAVAARLRARGRLQRPGEGSPRPAPVPGRAGPQPAAAQGDRHHGPRRRQAHGGRLRRVQARPPLDRRRHAVRQAERPGRDQDHRLPRAPHHDRATTSSSSPSTPTTATARVEDVTQRAQYESNDTEIAVVDGGRPGPHARA